MNLRIRSLSERGQTKKEYVLYDFIYSKSRKCNITYGERNKISGCLGTEVRLDGGVMRQIFKSHQKTFRGDRNGHCLLDIDGFMVNRVFFVCLLTSKNVL